MDLDKKYKAPEGYECNILQLVKIEPEWAANIIQYYETKIAALQSHNIAMVPCSCEKSLGYPGYIRPSESCPIEWHRELARNKQRGR